MIVDFAGAALCLWGRRGREGAWDGKVADKGEEWEGAREGVYKMLESRIAFYVNSTMVTQLW